MKYEKKTKTQNKLQPALTKPRGVDSGEPVTRQRRDKHKAQTDIGAKMSSFKSRNIQKQKKRIKGREGKIMKEARSENSK